MGAGETGNDAGAAQPHGRPCCPCLLPPCRVPLTFVEFVRDLPPHVPPDQVRRCLPARPRAQPSRGFTPSLRPRRPLACSSDAACHWC